MFRQMSILLALILLVGTQASAQEGFNLGNLDGTHWLSMDSNLKIGYVTGFLMGLHLMRQEALFDIWAYNKKKEFIESTDGLTKLIFPAALEKADSLSFDGITPGQIIDGLDVFYGDFSVRKVKVVDAAYVVKMQIGGMNPDLISAQVRYLKMQPINSETSNAYFAKVVEFFGDLPAAIKKNRITEEDLLKAGYFLDKGGELLHLFCYTKYWH